MGQKVNLIGLRLGINRTWDLRWFSGKNDYGKLLHEDMKIREELSEALKQAAVSRIVIERLHKKCRDDPFLGAPRRGDRQAGRRHREGARRRPSSPTATSSSTSWRSASPSSMPSWSPNRSRSNSSAAAFRRAMKRAVQSAMRLGAEGIRINCAAGSAAPRSPAWSGIARAAPLHTLRADVDFGVATAFTTYGTCGVKVDLQGQILEHDLMAQDKKMAEGEGGRLRRDAA